MLRRFVLGFFDLMLSPFVLAGSLLLLFVRAAGVRHMRIARMIFRKVGIFPIRDHYYEPFFNTQNIRSELDSDRQLPGIDWNVDEQLKLLRSFDYNEELQLIPTTRKKPHEFYYYNTTFGPGDAEYFYNVIRYYKPKRIIEVGCGNSTLLARMAIQANVGESPLNACTHTCIEPYEAPWLEQLGVTVRRELVEEVDQNLFLALDRHDILFIDSSHMIRPRGDVLFEYLQILPALRSGVLIHVHDIFSPKDYGEQWVCDDILFWNEQYLLEAFLTCNHDFRIIGALNYLSHHYPNDLAAKCPTLKSQVKYQEPGSLWMIRS